MIQYHMEPDKKQKIQRLPDCSVLMSLQAGVQPTLSEVPGKKQMGSAVSNKTEEWFCNSGFTLNYKTGAADMSALWIINKLTLKTMYRYLECQLLGISKRKTVLQAYTKSVSAAPILFAEQKK
ncbi:hypothetical protein AV530_004878 [Patagioenas fasciata monilis]|uniref:Uncharacterized protein n=1 Tax=Patagioenas fasciata monilis TaxID=372326 RepID=A0A1V4JTT0_PATFA|nr:hypothetical protein AV530_004878 [Patagioenas fasciata monilis]